jgi:prepilin-type N-terminal cleavage/methylation domain-containing protein|tara:strand:+ start:153 stop:635 length:483 start_codon:yes stop_codon:yes gene_type:complete
MNKKIKTNSGFTMMELVVTLALMGVLISFAIPAYNGVSEEMQGKRNVANMQTIREAFFHYFYRMHQQKGRIAHFPPPPENEMKIMDDDWANTPMDSLLSPMAPKDLFATGELPKNANNNAFLYETWNDTIEMTGEVMYYIKIEDIDEDSPSFGKSFTYSI